jgi:rubrerythrin
MALLTLLDEPDDDDEPWDEDDWDEPWVCDSCQALLDFPEETCPFCGETGGEA